MPKPVLLLLAVYGLGDDDFAVRQASERYLAASGHDAVLACRMAPYLTDSREAKKRLRRLEKNYYGEWGARIDRNDWAEYPSLALLSPWCTAPHDSPRNPWVLEPGDPFRPFVRQYYNRAAWAKYPRPGGGGGGWTFNAATLELCKDLRALGAPAWAGKALLAYLRWRVAHRERVDGVKDVHFSHR